MRAAWRVRSKSYVLVAEAQVSHIFLNGLVRRGGAAAGAAGARGRGSEPTTGQAGGCVLPSTCLQAAGTTAQCSMQAMSMCVWAHSTRCGEADDERMHDRTHTRAARRAAYTRPCRWMDEGAAVRAPACILPACQLKHALGRTHALRRSRQLGIPIRTVCTRVHNNKGAGWL